MGIQGHDLAILTARFGAGRFGASRFGFIPCPEDVKGPGTDEPGEYVWKETVIPSQEVETAWSLASEDCVCRQLCTMLVSGLAPDAPPVTQLVGFNLEFTLSSIRGRVDGVVKINWGDGQHTEAIVRPLENDDYLYPHTYLTGGSKTVSLQVTDENGCKVEDDLIISVTALDPLAGDFTAISSGAFDPGQGLLTLTPTITGGSGSYSYAWSAWTEWGGSEVAPAFTDTDEIGLWTPLYEATGGNGICFGEAKLIVTDTVTMLTLTIGPKTWDWQCV